jgi:hypothetical protein
MNMALRHLIFRLWIFPVLGSDGKGKMNPMMINEKAGWCL